MSNCTVLCPLMKNGFCELMPVPVELDIVNGKYQQSEDCEREILIRNFDEDTTHS